eukprot:6460758-Pyramimonas_sp.AAC.1
MSTGVIQDPLATTGAAAMNGVVHGVRHVGLLGNTSLGPTLSVEGLLSDCATSSRPRALMCERTPSRSASWVVSDDALP